MRNGKIMKQKLSKLFLVSALLVSSVAWSAAEPDDAMNPKDPKFKAEEPRSTLGSLLYGGSIGAVGLGLSGLCFGNAAKVPGEGALIGASLGAIVGGWACLSSNNTYRAVYEKSNGLTIQGAAANNNKDGVLAQIEYDSDSAVAQDKEGKTPLIYAAANDAREVAGILVAKIEGVGLLSGPYSERYLAPNTIERIYPFSCKAIDFQDPKFKRTAVVWAAINGHGGMVKQLLDAHADGSLQDTFGTNVDTVAEKKEEIKELLETKAKIYRQQLIESLSPEEKKEFDHAGASGNRGLQQMILWRKARSL